MRFGSGAAGPALGAEQVIAIGPQHPSAHGALQLAVRLAGDRVAAAEPLIGYMHRGAEKLFEVRDYRQIVMLANRHDWFGAFANELGVVLAVERMLGLPVPERAVWLRTLLAELNRVLSHLAFLGGHPLTAAAVGPTAARLREQLQGVLEEAAGGRVHYMFNRVGGVKEDVPTGWPDRVATAVAAVRTGLTDVVQPALADEGLRAAGSGVGRLDPDTAVAYGVSGPVARASGVDLDLRRDEPYLAYPALPVRVVTRTGGDVLARLECLAEQLLVSTELAAGCLAPLAELPGPVQLRLPKTVRAPEGETYQWTEAPLGIVGYYLVSRGGNTPWRLKLRTPSFNNVQVLRALLPGTRVSELASVLASMFFVVGDVDR